MQRTSRLLLILVAALGFDAAAISAQTSLAATDPASRAALLDSVGHARARWESARPQLYRVRVELLCECARTLDNAPWVLVRGDSILRDSVRQDQRSLVVSRPGYYTVDGLFAVLETALRDTLLTVTGVRFDPTLGTPLSFSTRLRCVSRCSTGGWSDVHLLGFEAARDGPRTTQFLLLPLMDRSAGRDPRSEHQIRLEPFDILRRQMLGRMRALRRGSGHRRASHRCWLKNGKLDGVVRQTSDAIPVDPVTRKIRWDAWPWAPASAESVPCS